MRWMLLVDTCGRSGGVAIANLEVQGDAGAADVYCVIAGRAIADRETQEQLMLAIADVLWEAHLAPSDLDVLAVVIGPGSFTGVRVGLAAVKGFAESLKLPVVAVSRLAVLAAQVPGDGPVQAWIDAGRGDVFAGRYVAGKAVSESMLRGEDAVANLQDGEAVVVMEASLRNMSPRLHLVPETGVHQALPLAVTAARARQFADAALVDANYLRVPDAELARKAALLAAGNP